MPLARSLPGEVGGRQFYEAWRASAWCPEDTLYFTVTGIMRPTEDRGRSFLALYTSEFRDLRRAAGSECPVTLEELYQRMESHQ